MAQLSKRSLLAVAALSAFSCTAPADAPVSIHYLGHSAFLLRFDNGLTALTDYGQSRAYGLESPVYDLGTAIPDIVTLSHDHADHSGGELPTGIGRVLTGDEGFEEGGVTVTAIRTFEGNLETPDNTSYLFEYRGKKILHLGDCQALIVGSSEQEVQSSIATLYPDNYDVVLVPIGFVRDILAEAAEFVTLIDARRVVPMHFWAPADRDTFLELLDGKSDSRGRPYRLVSQESATLELADAEIETDIVEVVALTPAPYGSVEVYESG